MSKKIICTKDEAIKIAKKGSSFKRTYYRVRVSPFLPTENNMGFDGYTSVRVTKAEFIKAIEDLLQYLEERGAKITLTVPEADFESFYI